MTAKRAVPAAADLSAAQARRIALAAQGFADPRPLGLPDRRALRRVLGRIGVLQIDSVNVLVRSHYLPIYSRIGPYPVTLLERAAWRAPRELFEYWGHEASLLPVAAHPLFRWRMERAASAAWGSVERIQRERPDYVERVLDEVRQRGPIGAGALEEERPRRSGPWWDWHDAKRALEWLFWCGRVTSAGRRGFERLYDLPERVLPAAVLATPTPSVEEAQRELLRISARALGVATARDLADYFEIGVIELKPRLAELVEAGELLPVTVEGWRQPAYLDPAARVPRRVRARALLSPFDSLVWDRPRAERLFGMRYRIEIYTPAERRVYGYYVLPFLLGETLTARVDLKADRAAGVLRAQATWAQDGHVPDEVAGELAAELRTMAGWLGMERVEAADRGDLAPALRRALAAQPAP
ncbi:MAG TPA: crosslink repair DNA glycosylase YcaQ family protein [Candidatus Dormibacteraeota bacterium]|nr:crosslink repair DNA glycosylase YcaQ family protein [Candidatus Dormibacteraeota bacterium]